MESDRDRQRVLEETTRTESRSGEISSEGKQGRFLNSENIRFDRNDLVDPVEGLEDQAGPTDAKSPTVLEEADLVAPAEGRGIMKSGAADRFVVLSGQSDLETHRESGQSSLEDDYKGKRSQPRISSN
ncbi:unnamed protein product [Arabis nemorensis]|uniref:Uncharacterized protein n=1 Tax=Arabis nemorensis TaxID=586526 RepID=A0A565CFX1_9BRAS|nr:unnamed protein product [Arabis nemorensis]